MAQGAYIGVSDKARRIAGGFIGVNGKARRISKAYIGVGGKARPCWDSGARIAYYGSATNLTKSARYFDGAYVGGHGIFSGLGNDNTGFTNAYTTTLTRKTATIPTGLSGISSITTIVDVFSAELSNYAVFIAGFSDNMIVYVYNASLTVSTLDTLTTPRRDAAVISIGDNVLIGGGTQDTSPNNDNVTVLDNVEVYTSNLTKGTPLTLSVARKSMGTAKNYNYALFAGGINPTSVNIVDAFNSNLVRTTPTVLSESGQYYEGATAGEHALLIHGTRKKQDAYNASLVKTTLNNDHVGFDCAKTNLNGYAIFAGGYNNLNGSNYVDIVHTYDDNLVHGTAKPLDKPTRLNAGVSVGDYALIAGGFNGSSVLSNVIVYTYLS